MGILLGPLIAQSMGTGRSEEIKKYIHFADNNNLPADDKLAKIRSLQNDLRNSLLQFAVFSSNLSINEQMVQYFGKHSLRTFILGNPICF